MWCNQTSEWEGAAPVNSLLGYRYQRINVIPPNIYSPKMISSKGRIIGLWEKFSDSPWFLGLHINIITGELRYIYDVTKFKLAYNVLIQWIDNRFSDNDTLHVVTLLTYVRNLSYVFSNFRKRDCNCKLFSYKMYMFYRNSYALYDACITIFQWVSYMSTSNTTACNKRISSCTGTARRCVSVENNTPIPDFMTFNSQKYMNVWSTEFYHLQGEEV